MFSTGPTKHDKLNAVIARYRGQLTDKQTKFLSDYYPRYKGSIGDREYKVLGELGYEGSLNDRWNAYMRDLGGKGMESLDVLYKTFYGAAGYHENDKDPQLVVDTVNEFYRKDGEGTKGPLEKATPFNHVVKHNSSTAGNATMTGDYGPELITNGGFDSSDGWDTDGDSEIVDGQARIYSPDGSISAVKQYQVLEVGKTYECTFEVTRVVTGTNLVVTSSNDLIEIGANQTGVYKFTFTAEFTTFGLKRSSGATDIYIDNISVREVPKIQWRPHNLLTYSEDFTDSDWTKTNTTVTANAAVAPDGTTTADEISHTTSSASLNRYVAAHAGADILQTFGIYLKYVDHQWFYAYVDSTYVWVDLLNGVIGTDQTDGASLTDVGNGWYYLSVPEAQVGSAYYLQLGLATGNTQTVEATGTSAYIWGAHLYRSDLGGMADVPASERVLPSANTYVRTAGREVSGIELVENGTFDTDYTNWTNYNGGTISVSNGELNISTDPTIPNTGVYQQFDTIVGRVYQVSGDVTSVDSTPRLLIGNGIGSGLYVNVSHNNHGETKTLSGTFVAVATTTYISLQTAPVNSQSKYDNISIKEIDVNPSTARYLPRIGHHVYNGSQWVNEGLLHESKARTNLVTYSEDLSNSAWLKQDSSVAAADDAFGLKMWTITDSNSSAYGIVIDSITIPDQTQFTVSLLVKKNDSPTSQFSVRVRASNGSTIRYIGDSLNVDDGTADGGMWAGDRNATFVEDWGTHWKLNVTGTFPAGYTQGQSLEIFPAHNNTSGSGSSANTGSHVVGGVQVETGSVASSYIPTSGSTVTRAAETLTIEHENLPWPSPVVIGDELVTNGTFESDLSGWTTASADWTWDSGSQRAYLNTTTKYQSITYDTDYTSGGMQAGQLYLIEFDYELVSGSFRFALQSVNEYKTIISTLGSGHFSLVVTRPADNRTDTIQIRNQSGATELYIDNVSVKEINPLSVSIAMEGRMTYADTGVYGAVIPFEWKEDNDNKFAWELSTNSTDQGRFVFLQDSSSVRDIVSSGTDDYLPDVLVPFNLSSRYTSNALNAAIDGVSLTANTTPTSIPDLEDIDFTLGKNFMGTIGSLRIWANDIGDDGIIEASEPELQPTLSLSFDGTETSFIDFEWSE